MKNLILTLLTACSLLFGCSKNNDKPDDAQNKKLREIIATITPYKFGQPASSDKFVWSTTKFDGDGNIVYLSERKGVDVFDGSKSYEDPTTFKYQDGKMVEKQDYNFRYAYSYSGQDTLEIKRYTSAGLFETLKYEYSQNKVATVKYYYSDGNISSLHRYSYNNAGLVSKIDIFYTPFDGGDQLQYTYNGKGNVITESYFDRDRGTTTVQMEFAYQYDDSGRIKEYIYSWGILSFRKLKNSYDAEGKLVQVDIFTGDKLDGPFEQKGIIKYDYMYK